MAAKNRKPGAQPGNMNALRHGFYSKQRKLLEAGNKDIAIGNGLMDLTAEIGLMRNTLARLSDETQASREPETIAALLNVFGLAVCRVATLIRTQHLIAGNRPGFLEGIIQQALSDYIAEMGLDDGRG